MFVALGSPLFHFIFFFFFMGSSSKEHIHGVMPTYVRLVDQTIRYTTPRIVPSFQRGEKKKRKDIGAVRPCSFLLDVIFLGFFTFNLITNYI